VRSNFLLDHLAFTHFVWTFRYADFGALVDPFAPPPWMWMRHTTNWLQANTCFVVTHPVGGGAALHNGGRRRGHRASPLRARQRGCLPIPAAQRLVQGR
jgi:hypothetical protein